jgi:hypothetical protein
MPTTIHATATSSANQSPCDGSNAAKLPLLSNTMERREFENFTAQHLKKMGYPVPSPHLIRGAHSALEQDQSISKEHPIWLAEALRQMQGCSTTQKNIDSVVTEFLKLYLSNSKLTFDKALDLFLNNPRVNPREEGWRSMTSDRYNLGRMRVPVLCEDSEN